MNETLRAGLLSEVEVCEPFRTRPLTLGEPLADALDRTGELLSDLDVDDRHQPGTHEPSSRPSRRTG